MSLFTLHISLSVENVRIEKKTLSCKEHEQNFQECKNVRYKVRDRIESYKISRFSRTKIWLYLNKVL